MDPVAVAGTMTGYREPVQVCARAAGKIILASEHAVVHGSAAVTSPPPLTSTPTPRPSLFFHVAGAPAHPPTHTLASFHSSSLARCCCWHPSHTVLPTSSRAGLRETVAVLTPARWSWISWSCSRLRGVQGEESANSRQPGLFSCVDSLVCLSVCSSS